MAPPTNSTIAERVRAAMEEAGVSEVVLADDTGIPRTTLRRRLTGLSDWLTGELTPQTAQTAEPDYLTAAEVGTMLRCSATYAGQLLKAGKIPGVNLGGGLGWRAHRADVEAFVRGRAAAKATAPRAPRAAK
jgi:excisionase family DNA binding protein